MCCSFLKKSIVYSFGMYWCNTCQKIKFIDIVYKDDGKIIYLCQICQTDLFE